MFTQVLKMSISASWVVLAVILLRLVLKKAPKAIHCALWILVAIRLICPITPESEFSLMAPEKSEATVSTLMDDYVGSTNVYWDITAEYDMALDAGITPIRAEGGGSYVVTGTTPFTEPTRLADVMEPIWVFGMCAMGLYALVSFLAVRRRVRACIKLDKTVRLCDHIDSPFILGIIRPKIYLPSELDPMTAGHVLAHEQAHLKRRDHWWKPLGFALLTVYWFNPVMWLSYVLLCRDIEKACDEKVIRELDTDGKKAYSMALLQCSVPRRMIAACPLAFGEVGVKSRIQSVLSYKKPAFWVMTVAILSCIAAAVCFLTDPKDEGPSAYDVTSALWIYDTKTVDVTVWDDSGSHRVYLTKPQIEKLSEMIHYLEADEFIKEKPKKHLLYSVLDCEDFDIELHWDGEFAYFTFDAATEADITSNRRSVKNDELNVFLAEVMEMEYRLAEGTYVPIEAASLYGEAPDVLNLVENRRYEVTEDGLTVLDLGNGDMISYVFNWCWEGLNEAHAKLDSFTRLNYHDSFFDLRIELDDTDLKYQHLYDNCHVILQDETLYWIDGQDRLKDGRINWTVYELAKESPYLFPPTNYQDFFKNAIEYKPHGTAFVRSGGQKPGYFGLTETELNTLCSVLKQIPEEAIQPGNEMKDYYVTLSVGSQLNSKLYCNAYFWYCGGQVGMYWTSWDSEDTACYRIDYAPLTSFLSGLMRPDRIDTYTVLIDPENPAYVSYTHDHISISLIKVLGWDYEIVPYVDEETDFGIRCKPEWLDDWLFFGYMKGELVPESTFLQEVRLSSGRFGWTYLFEPPIEGDAKEDGQSPYWKMIYRYQDGGTYYIYIEGEFDERLQEHDRSGFRYIVDSFEFGMKNDEAIIALSRNDIDAEEYENPEVSYDAQSNSYEVLWHRKNSNGYTIVSIDFLWDDTVVEVFGE